MSDTKDTRGEEGEKSISNGRPDRASITGGNSPKSPQQSLQDIGGNIFKPSSVPANPQPSQTNTQPPSEKSD